MATEPRQRPKRRESYFRHTRRPLHCLAFIALPLLFFQVGSLKYGTSLLAPRHLATVLRYFGATAPFLPPLLIVLVLLLQHVFRRDPWQVRPKVLAGMTGESILAMVPLIALGHVAGRIAAGAAATTPAPNAMQQVLMAVGAGIYEEFIFRLVMISAVMLLFVDVFEFPRDIVGLAAVLVAAVLFSLYHFLGATDVWSDFPWSTFLFRALAGVYLGGLFIFRGFAVAVGAHILYNVYVFAAS